MIHNIVQTSKEKQRYISPQADVVRISIGTSILQASLNGTPGVNGYGEGSESYYGFGDDE